MIGLYQLTKKENDKLGEREEIKYCSNEIFQLNDMFSRLGNVDYGGRVVLWWERRETHCSSSSSNGSFTITNCQLVTLVNPRRFHHLRAEFFLQLLQKHSWVSFAIKHGNVFAKSTHFPWLTYFIHNKHEKVIISCPFI